MNPQRAHRQRDRRYATQKENCAGSMAHRDNGGPEEGKKRKDEQNRHGLASNHYFLKDIFETMLAFR